MTVTFYHNFHKFTITTFTTNWHESCHSNSRRMLLLTLAVACSGQHSAAAAGASRIFCVLCKFSSISTEIHYVVCCWKGSSLCLNRQLELAFIGKENLTSCLCVSEIESHVERGVSHASTCSSFLKYCFSIPVKKNKWDSCEGKQLICIVDFCLKLHLTNNVQTLFHPFPWVESSVFHTIPFLKNQEKYLSKVKCLPNTEQKKMNKAAIFKVYYIS